MHDPTKKADKFWKRKKRRKNTNVAGFNFEQNISLLRKEIFAAQSKAKLLVCWQNIIFFPVTWVHGVTWCHKGAILFNLKLGKLSNKWMNPINFWQIKWISAKNISVREFNLRIRKLGSCICRGEFAIKLGYFLCQQKAKNSRNLKANILWAVCHFCRTVFAATAYGMRLMYLYFVGL